MIKVLCKDGVQLEISRESANYFDVIKEMLEDDESEEVEIPLLEVDADNFKLAVEFVDQYRINPCNLTEENVDTWFDALPDWYKDYSTRIVFHKLMCGKCVYFLNCKPLITFLNLDLVYKMKKSNFDVKITGPLLSPNPVELSKEQVTDILMKNKDLIFSKS